MEQPRSTVNKQVKTLVDIWPVLIFILGLTFATARADTILTGHTTSIDQLKGSAIENTDRLARIETKLDFLIAKQSSGIK